MIQISRRARIASLWLPCFAGLVRGLGLPGMAGGMGWLLVLLAPLPRFAGWARGTSWRAEWLGGTVFWALVYVYLAEIHPLMLLASAPLQGLWWVLEHRLYLTLRRAAPFALAAPLALLAGEWLRAVTLYGGVPWALPAMGLGDSPAALWLARGVGESGLSVLLVLWAGVVLGRVRGERTRQVLWAPALTLVAVAMAFAAPRAPVLDTVTVLAVQPNLDPDDKHSSDRVSFFRSQLDLSEAAVAAVGRPEILVWAETMFPFPVVAEDARGQVVLPDRRKSGVPYDAEWLYEYQSTPAFLAARLAAPDGWFLAGAHFYRPLPEGAAEDARSPRSSRTLAFDGDGRLRAHVPKSELVPIGEALPFAGLLPRKLVEGVADWIYGFSGLLPTFERLPVGGPMRLSRPGGGEHRLGVAVCWENVFESVFRIQADRGAQAFLVLSNESWYGLGAELDQMRAATRFRAVETGRAVFRATNTGLTVLVHADGRMGEALQRGVEGWLQVALPLVDPSARTPYLLGGWLLFPAAGLIGLLLGVAGLFRRWRGRSWTASPAEDDSDADREEAPVA